MDARKNDPAVADSDRELVVTEYGTTEGGKQTLVRLAEFLEKYEQRIHP